MFRGISNDQSLEDACPSLARAAQAFRDQGTADPGEPVNPAATVGVTEVDRLGDIFRSMERGLADQFVPEAMPRQSSRELPLFRAELAETLSRIAANPVAAAHGAQLDDAAFDRIWQKSLKVSESLDAAIARANAKLFAGDALAALHANLLDASMECNRALSRTMKRDELRGSTVEPTNPDDTAWTVRGL